MAERRMMSKKVIHGDHFMDLPATTKVLYFYLMLEADDDGFVNSPKRIQRMIGATDDDARLLIAKRFILSFESGIIVVKHWKMHNYIRNDRYKSTTHTEEMALLSLKDNGVYTLDTVGIPSGSIGKDSIGEVSIDENHDSVMTKSKYHSELFNTDEVNAIVKYRNSIKSPLKSQKGYKGLENKISEVMDKFNITLIQVLDIMAHKEWKSIEVDWINNIGIKPIQAKKLGGVL